MGLHTQWRDCTEWDRSGLALSTTNDEAAKMYDAVLTQMLGFREDPSVGGLAGAMTAMKSADPEFVMGHVMSSGLKIIGSNQIILKRQPELQRELDELIELSKRPTTPWREQKHVDAVCHWASGEIYKACDVYEEIILEHPTDILALKLAHAGYFTMGVKDKRRDLVGKVLPLWSPDMPHYGYLHGMQAFGLVETNYFYAAEWHAKQALDINPQDCWATHALAHVHHMMGRLTEGKQFLQATEHHWSGAQMLAHHNYWHWALLEIEEGNHADAIGVFDNHINPNAVQEKTIFDILDTASLLKRLELEGVDVGDRWEDIFEISRPHIEDHLSVLGDIHLLIACLGAKQEEVTTQMMASVDDFIREESGDQHKFMKDFGRSILQSFVAYEEGDYAKTTDLLYPIRYQIPALGGSYAQVDLVNLFLIQAAIKSPSSRHHKLARQMLAERQSLNPESPMAERLLTELLTEHIDE